MKKRDQFIIGAVALSGIYLVLNHIANNQRADSVFDNEPEQKNPMEGKRVVFVEDENDKENADGVKGHLEAVDNVIIEKSMYDKNVKRVID